MTELLLQTNNRIVPVGRAAIEASVLRSLQDNRVLSQTTELRRSHNSEWPISSKTEYLHRKLQAKLRNNRLKKKAFYDPGREVLRSLSYDYCNPPPTPSISSSATSNIPSSVTPSIRSLHTPLFFVDTSTSGARGEEDRGKPDTSCLTSDVKADELAWEDITGVFEWKDKKIPFRLLLTRQREARKASRNGQAAVKKEGAEEEKEEKEEAEVQEEEAKEIDEEMAVEAEEQVEDAQQDDKFELLSQQQLQPIVQGFRYLQHLHYYRPHQYVHLGVVAYRDYYLVLIRALDTISWTGHVPWSDLSLLKAYVAEIHNAKMDDSLIPFIPRDNQFISPDRKKYHRCFHIDMSKFVKNGPLTHAVPFGYSLSPRNVFVGVASICSKYREESNFERMVVKMECRDVERSHQEKAILKLIHTKKDTTDVEWTPGVVRIIAELSGDVFCDSCSKCNDCDQRKEECDKCEKGCVKCTWNDARYLGFTPELQTPRTRKRTATVLGTVAEPLSNCKSVLGFLEVIYDLLEVHRYLIKEKNVLHRDVSWMNILINPKHYVGDQKEVLKDAGDKLSFITDIFKEVQYTERVVLADFDTSTRWDGYFDPPETGGTTMTGTPMFMAAQFFRVHEDDPRKEKPLYDRESIEKVDQEFYRSLEEVKCEKAKKYCLEMKMKRFAESAPLQEPSFRSGSQRGLRLQQTPATDVESIFWVVILFFLRADAVGSPSARDIAFQEMQKDHFVNRLDSILLWLYTVQGAQSRAGLVATQPIVPCLKMLTVMAEYFYLTTWHLYNVDDCHAHSAFQRLLLPVIAVLRTRQAPLKVKVNVPAPIKGLPDTQYSATVTLTTSKRKQVHLQPMGPSPKKFRSNNTVSRTNSETPAQAVSKNVDDPETTGRNLSASRMTTRAQSRKDKIGVAGNTAAESTHSQSILTDLSSPSTSQEASQTDMSDTESTHIKDPDYVPEPTKVSDEGCYCPWPDDFGKFPVLHRLARQYMRGSC